MFFLLPSVEDHSDACKTFLAAMAPSAEVDMVTVFELGYTLACPRALEAASSILGVTAWLGLIEQLRCTKPGSRASSALALLVYMKTLDR